MSVLWHIRDPIEKEEENIVHPQCSNLPVVSKDNVEFTQYTGSFSQFLTGRLVEAAKKSGVTISFIRGEQAGFVTLCIERGREEDFWAAFK